MGTVSSLADHQREPEDEGEQLTYNGLEVRETMMKVTAVNIPWYDSGKCDVDDIVSFTVEGRVIGVNHEVDREGNLVRTAKIRPVEIESFKRLTGPA